MYEGKKLTEEELTKMKMEYSRVYTKALKEYSAFLPIFFELKMSLDDTRTLSAYLCDFDGFTTNIYKELSNLTKAIKSLRDALRKP